MTIVKISKKAKKDISKVPDHIREKFDFWVVSVEKDGLLITRKRHGWHDEPLKGRRSGERSVRLNKQWRLIYVVKSEVYIDKVFIEEVSPHEYEK